MTQHDDLPVRLLSAPRPRWGWQYVDPGPPRPAPMLWSRPVWREPGAPDISDLLRSKARARERRGLKIAAVVVLALVGLNGPSAVLLFAVLLGLAFVAPVVLANTRISQRQDQARLHQQQVHAEFQAAHHRWQADVAGHDQAERHRLAGALHFYPVPVTDTTTRFDVFGGTAEGWLNLVTTIGSSLLGSSAPLMVLDLTDDELGAPIAALARHHQIRVREHRLPEDLAALGWLSGREPEELAELLARVVHTGASSQEDRDVLLATDQLLAVIGALGADVTLAGIAEGLHVLNRSFDETTMTSTTLEQRSAISARIDLLTQSERARDELSRVLGVLERLARDVRDASPAPLDPADAVVALRAGHRSDLQRDIVQTLVFQALLLQIQDGDDALAGRTLVVAGADRMGLRNLERLHTLCRRNRMRLVYLFHHLRDDLEQLIGAADGEVLLMRMTNGREAAAAAEFIGRHHTFEVGQVTRGFSLTDTLGGGTNSSTTTGTSLTRGSGSGRGGRTSNQSVSQSFSHTSGTSSNWSEAIGENRGTTETRVYEFEVEPTAIAAMEDTAFFLVHRDRRGRRVVLGDCALGFLEADRVADHPYGEARDVTARVPAPAAEVGLLVNDPGQDLAGRLPHLAANGYRATWEDAYTPAARGWRISRHDDRPMVDTDERRVEEILSAHQAF